MMRIFQNFTSINITHNNYLHNYYGKIDNNLIDMFNVIAMLITSFCLPIMILIIVVGLYFLIKGNRSM
jgi:hypothetical protein